MIMGFIILTVKYTIGGFTGIILPNSSINIVLKKTNQIFFKFVTDN